MIIDIRCLLFAIILFDVLVRNYYYDDESECEPS